MNVELKPEIESRLQQLAHQRRQSVLELVEQILVHHLNSAVDEPLAWVQATQQQLGRVWPVEDFSEWKPPNAS